MCNCKTDIEAQLTARFQAKYPEATGHRATLEGYGFAVVDNTMTLMPYMPAKFGAGHTNKKTGLARWKGEKGTMSFRFCPFCGVNLLEKAETPNAKFSGGEAVRCNGS